MLTQVRLIGRWLNRLRFKTTWKRYISNDISYIVFKESVFILVNDIRKAMGNDPFSFEKFDNGWQWLTVGSEDYKVAYDAMVNLIYGWW